MNPRAGVNDSGVAGVYSDVKGILAVMLLCLTACAGCVTASTSTATVPTITTSTASTTTTPTRPTITSSITPLDPLTLRPTAPATEMPGHLSDQHVVLPDGRIVIVSSASSDTEPPWLNIFDPESGTVDNAALTDPVSELIGYSEALERVVLLVGPFRNPQIALFDPVSMTGDTADPFKEAEDDWWPHEMALFDEGRKVAIYTAPGYDTQFIHEPPRVEVLDIETNTLGDPIAVDNVLHGYVELLPEFVRQPDFPYGEVEPGIAFDTVTGRLFVANADGASVTAVDLMTGDVEVASLQPQPSFWGRALSWLIPPAEAKGSEPSAWVSAWLSDDRARLFITGHADDAWRDSEDRLHTTTQPLGLTVVDTDTLSVIHTLELPVSQGLSTSDGLALTGTTSNRVWCDDECRPGTNEPDVVEEEAEATGLYVLDPATLDIRAQLRPGVFYLYMHSFEDWLITENDHSDGYGFESIDLRTGEIGPRLIGTESSYLLVTEAGIFEVDIPPFDS